MTPVTEEVMEEVKNWQNRQLDAVYPILLNRFGNRTADTFLGSFLARARFPLRPGDPSPYTITF
jgi:hypothetical protein